MFTTILEEAMNHMNTFRLAYDHVDILICLKARDLNMRKNMFTHFLLNRDCDRL